MPFAGNTISMRKDVLDDYRKSCTALAEAVNEVLFESSRDWYWVGDVVGGLCDYDDTDYLTTDEMSLIIEYDVDYDMYAAWRDANMSHTKNINLISWIKGLRYDDIE